MSAYNVNSDRASLLGNLRTSPCTPQFCTGANLTAREVRQMQVAAYYQQVELAQQQAALEMQLQLEQMRLQNLALQEQIMLGQAAQAQAEAMMQQRLGERPACTPTAKPAVNGSNRIAAGQAGILAERALARRQAQEERASTPIRDSTSPVSAAYQTPAQRAQQPQHQGHHRKVSSTGSVLSSSTSNTPALILSRPGESYPIAAPVVMSSPIADAGPNSAAPFVSHKHSDSEGSSNSTRSSLSSFGKEGESSEASLDSPPSDIVSFVVNKGKQKKLNPCSSVFVPSFAPTSPTGGARSISPAQPISPLVYRAPRSGSPAAAGSPSVRTGGLLKSTASAPAGALAIRQPRGPPASAEDLGGDNFKLRLRKRAIAGIRALGVRVPSQPGSPAMAQFGFQGAQAQELGVWDQAKLGTSSGALSPGLAALVQATKAREDKLKEMGL